MNEMTMVFDEVVNMIFTKETLLLIIAVGNFVLLPKILINFIKAVVRPPRRIVREIYSDVPAACKDFMPERCMVCAELSDGRCMAQECPEWETVDCVHCARYSTCDKRREGEKE